MTAGGTALSREVRPTHHVSAERAAFYRAARYWRDEATSDLLDRCAQRFPDRHAISAGAAEWTFGELRAAAMSVAGELLSRGLKPREAVCFQLPNWIEAAAVYHGILMAGGVAVPVSPILRDREVSFILGQTGARVAIAPQTYRGFDYAGMYVRLAEAVPHLEHRLTVRPAQPSSSGLVISTESNGVTIGPDRVGRGDEASTVLFTSGTTADPKGAILTHDSFLCGTRAVVEWFALNENDRIFNPSPVTHATGLCFALMLPVVTGCSVVLQDLWDPEVAFEKIVAHRVTGMAFATPFLAGITEVAEHRDTYLDHIRFIVCGGADVPRALAERADARLGAVVRMYGATEGIAASSGSPWHPPSTRWATEGQWTFPTEARIVAEEVNAEDAARPAAAGEIGEVEWRAPQMCRGYLDPELNDEAFTGEGFFRTGDLATVDEQGLLTLRGRLKDIINRGGEKISAKEIEDLIHEHPDVRDVAVTAMPDPILGETVCAWVVPAPGAQITLEGLTAHLGTYRLARQKLPQRLEIIDQLPRTPSGKIQKFRLRDGLRANESSEFGPSPAGGGGSW